MKEAFAYIDPGSGFVFLQQTSFLWAIILTLIGIFLLFIKLFLKSIKRFLWIFIVIVIILITIGVVMNKNFVKQKVVVLGIDAMDPAITERLLSEGKLPNFSYLKNQGSYSLLKTTNPSESVVAWTSFATGLNPGSHGIFDFIMRDPSSYMPYLSLNEVTTTPKLKIEIRRKGKTFWQQLSKHKIPSFIFFCPNTFPPEKLNGKMLSGMGVPCVYGTMGRFSFYTSKNITEEKIKDSRGKLISITANKDVIHTNIFGPKIKSKGLITEMKIPLTIILRPRKEEIELKFQKNRLLFKKGSWSNWQRIYFMVGPFKKIYGIAKFYLKNIEPDFELYLSPINFDPQNPLFPISYPKDYSKKLANKIGLYYTQGMPHDTWALTEGWLDEKAFLEQTDMILEERKKILIEGLKKIKGGVFFFYFDTLDIIQHMFWRYIDSKHPLFEDKSPYKDTIFNYYQKVDNILGEVLNLLDKDITLIILSDHGFTSFRRSVHLNLWLLENGFLALKEGKNQSEEFFKDVDWFKTKAYALGFGGIYINKRERESQGIVNKSEERELIKSISNKLELLKDLITQENIIKEIYLKEEIFKGPYTDEAPDLFVGFNSGYRASWQTALGAVPEILIEDNKRKWSGDHLVDPSLVPGVIFINKKTILKDPSIIDLAPTILKLFSLPKYEELDGNNLF